MKKYTFVLFALAICRFCFSQSAHQEIYLANVTVVDVINGENLVNMTVVVSDSLVTAVGLFDEIEIPKKAKVIDCTGKFLVPGLWDMHVHLGNATELALPLFVANGVTGVRDMGSKNFDLIEKWKNQINSATIIGPRIISPGPILNGGKDLPDFQIAVNTPVEAKHAVDSLVRMGVDFIKVHSGISRETYFAIAEECAKNRIPFAGHVPTSSTDVSVSGEEASEAGQRSLEHMLGIPFARDTIKAFQNMYPTEESLNHLFAILLKNQTYVTPTLSIYYIPSDYLAVAENQNSVLKYISPELTSFWQSQISDWPQRNKSFMSWLLTARMNMIPALRDAGILLLAGTDTGFPFVLPGFGLHNELALLVDAGLTPLEALRTATINPAIFFGKSDHTGSIERQKLADLVLLNANPMLDIKNLRQIEAVFVNGKLYERSTIDKELMNVARKVSGSN